MPGEGGAIEQAVLYLREHPERLWNILSRITEYENTDSCWLWTGAKSGGSGKVYVNGLVVHVGGLLVRYYAGLTGKPTHTCGTVGCVNPWHVGLPGKDVHKKRVRATATIFVRQVNSNIARSCKNGHPIVGKNVYISRKKLKSGYVPRYCCRICQYRALEKSSGYSNERSIRKIEQEIAERTSNGS